MYVTYSMKNVPSPKRSQIARTAETQAVLISAAARLLATVGFAKTTTQTIAAEAGVTTGALHHHFPSKDDLMMAVLDQSTITIEEKLRVENGGPISGKAGIRQMVDHLWQIYGQPEYWAVWEIIIGTRTDPEFHGRITEHRSQSMANIVLPWLERVETLNGSTGQSLDIFEFMLIAIRGLSLERFMDKDAAYFERNLAMLADFASFHLQGAATQPAAPQETNKKRPLPHTTGNF